jgi:hypothetical protein
MMTNIKTVPLSTRDFMDHYEFTLGVIDARAGRPFRDAYDMSWSRQQQLYYEAGRLAAKVLPPGIKTRTARGRPNPQAVRYLERVRL